MKKILIIGGGDMASKVIFLIQKIKKFKIIGYVDKKNKGTIFKIKRLGSDKDISKIIKKYKNINAVIAFGSTPSLLSKRSKMIRTLKKNNIKTPNIISPLACIDVNKKLDLGEGNIIFQGCKVDYESKLGNFNIFNVNVTISHHCIFSENSMVHPGAVILGRVKIGKNVFIGANATVNPSVTILSGCVVGSGSVVVKKILHKGTYVGIPAKKIKKKIK